MKSKKFLNILSENECDFILDSFNKDSTKHNYQLTNDTTLLVRNPTYLDEFLLKGKDFLESILDYVVIPEYSMVIKYIKGGKLPKHIDNAAETGFTILISQSDDISNPIILYENPKVEVILNRGDGLLFNGSNVYHERPVIESDYLVVCLLGYKFRKKILM